MKKKNHLIRTEEADLIVFLLCTLHDSKDMDLRKNWRITGTYFKLT